MTERYEVRNDGAAPYPWTVIERPNPAAGFTMTIHHPFPDEASAKRFAGEHSDGEVS